MWGLPLEETLGLACLLLGLHGGHQLLLPLTCHVLVCHALWSALDMEEYKFEVFPCVRVAVQRLRWTLRRAWWQPLLLMLRWVTMVFDLGCT